MRPWLLTLSLAVFATPALADDAPKAQPAACPGPAVVQTKGSPARAVPLNQLPPASMVLTVLRTIDGCSVLDVKSGGVVYHVPEGGAPRAQPVDRIPRQR